MTGSHENSRGRLPDFLVVGAAKSGTTALYRHLAQHPQVFMSENKEPHFFSFVDRQVRFVGPGDDWLNNNTVTDQRRYAQLFANAQPEQIAGEASAMYLYVEGTAERIMQLLPEAKLIAMLRHPVDRAYSAFNHLRRDGREPEESFFDALAREEQRVRDGWAPIWHYRRMGNYASQLQAYRDFIDSGQMLVVLYDDFRSDPDTVVAQVGEFLGINAPPSTESTRYNQSGIP
ncbi:MAG: sulfotransferase, partial [Rhodothermia bacterium]|nr:sulfotransferase [Rhodothermia bacterium]